jgi:hypothetical protein
MSAVSELSIERQRTHSGTPEDLDIAVRLEPEAKRVASQKPQPRAGCGLAQHILIDSSEIGYQLQDRPQHVYMEVGVVVNVVVVNNIIVIPSCDGECRVRDLKIMGVGERCGYSSRWRRDTSNFYGLSGLKQLNAQREGCTSAVLPHGYYHARPLCDLTAQGLVT